MLRARPRGPSIGYFEQMRHAIVLCEVDELLGGRRDLIERLIEPLASHDHQKGTEYVRTLEVYLESFGDIRTAAARLHIHPNSLRYRVNRLAEMAQFDLADSEVRLAMQLALRARHR